MATTPAPRKPAASRRTGVRERAARATREAILRAATRIFAKHGYTGGRVEQISKAAKSYDRMIYYYFGSKEALFIAVLEEAYRRMNDAEAELALPEDDPVASLRAFVGFVWRYYQRHPEFITLLNSENLHRGRHIAKSLGAREYSSPALLLLGRLLQAGAERGVFRADVRARDIYLQIASMGYFYLSNRYTLSAFLGENLEDPAALAHWESFMTEAVLRMVAPASSPAHPAGAARARRLARA